MEFKRRLKLYFVGLGLGVILSFLFFGKGCSNTGWAPGPRVKKRLKTTLIRATPIAQQELEALHIDLATLRASLDSSEVDFKNSRRTDDSLYYTLTSSVGGKPVVFTVAALRDYVVDSTATLRSVRMK